MVVWTILDHFGPVHFPTVPRPKRPIRVKTSENFAEEKMFAEDILPEGLFKENAPFIFLI